MTGWLTSWLGVIPPSRRCAGFFGYFGCFAGCVLPPKHVLHGVCGVYRCFGFHMLAALCLCTVLWFTEDLELQNPHTAHAAVLPRESVFVFNQTSHTQPTDTHVCIQ